MGHNYGHFNWKLRISILIYSLISIPHTSSSSSVCSTCEDECPTESTDTDTCHCVHRSYYHENQRWDGWKGRYVTTSRDFLYATADCDSLNDIQEDSVLNPSTCPENPCKYIRFTRSKISKVPINFFKASTHLEQIYLNSSGVRSLQVGAFYGLPKLEILQLEINELTEIAAGLLNTLSSLKTLDLHSNKIKKIEDMAFLGLESLESLDLSSNRLSVISHSLLKPLINLRELILSHNFISVLDFDTSYLQKLESLYVNNNNIENIDGCLKDTVISSLFLQDNSISYLNGSCLPVDLSILNLANNNLTLLDSSILDNMSKLTSLNVSKNGITEIPLDTFKSSENLLILDLSQNDITGLKTGVFSVCKNIEYLNLSSTNLERVYPHVFIPLINMKILDISSNNLDFFYSESFDHFDNLEKVFLGGNNFSCKFVSSIFQKAKTRNFSLVYDVDYTVENIKGLACTYITNDQENSPKNSTSTITWNELQNSLKNFSENVIEEIGDKLDVDIPKKIENSLITDVKLQTNKLKLELQNMYKLSIDSLKNLTNLLNTKSTYNHGISHSAINNSFFLQNLFTPVSNSTKKDSDSEVKSKLLNIEKKLSSLFFMEIIALICISVCSCILVVCIILSCCSKRKTTKRSFDLGQELPILS